MRAMTPWTGFTSLKKEMDRLLDRFDFELPELRGLGEWTPALDFKETPDAFVATVEVPGIDPKELDVNVEGQVLTIKGEKKQEREEKGEQYYRMERSWGAFARSLRLPAPVDAAKVTAGFKNGVLTVTLPKAPGSKGVQVTVRTE